MRQARSVDYLAILEALRSHANPVNVAGMARYGINVERAFGVPMPVLRKIGKQAGRNHARPASCGSRVSTRRVSWRRW